MVALPRAAPGAPDGGVPTLHALTGVRIFAALLVVVHHFGGGVVARFPWPVQNLALRGNLGVNLFYILSGFIILYSHRDRLEGVRFARGFMIARVARIYPVYLLSLAISMPVWVADFASRKSGSELVGKIVLATASRLTLTQAWSDRLIGYWNPPSWSLSAEWFFYVVFAVPVARAALRRASANALAGVIGMWLCTVAIGFGAWWLARGAGTDRYAYLPVLHAPQFVLGVFLAYDWTQRRAVVAGWLTDVLALASIGIVILAGLVPNPMVQYGSPAVVFAPLIYALAGGRGVSARLLSWRPVRFLGEASYAVYVLHWPVHDLQAILWRRLGFDTDGGLFFASYVLVVLALSSLAYQLVEVPARKRLRGWLESRLGRPQRAS